MKNVFENIDSVVGFNTDDGIRRATTVLETQRADRIAQVSIPMTVLGGLQPLKLEMETVEGESFNTDDGIRRATTLCP